LNEINKDWQAKAKENYDENLAFLKSLKTDRDIDKQSAEVHTEVFAEIDCLACANCCKTTPALVTKKDAKRIGKFLGLPPKTFIRKYLIEDINGELLINKVPCTFLNEDNTCQIYEVRPQACRQYPHTDQEGFRYRAKMNATNTIVCPATFEIVERLKKIKLEKDDI